MTIKVLLVGCGEHSSENLIPSLMAIGAIEVSGLADPSRDALQKAGRWFPQARQHSVHLLSGADIQPFDAIVVAAPPQVHEYVARLAIDSGKSVFVEKPPTVYTQELRKLADTAKQKNIVTCVGHNLRHSDAALEFRNAIVSPGFGRPVAMEMRYLASKPRGARWGIESPLRSFLLSHANHAIDLMIYQMGDLREVVAARAWPDVNGGIAIAAQFMFRSGAVGTLLATSYAPYFTVSASVVSDTGNLASLSGLYDVQIIGPNELGKRWGNTWRPRTLESGYGFTGYQTELERFFNSVASGSPEDVHPSFADEVAVYEAMDEIEKNIELADGREVHETAKPSRF